MPRVTTSNVQAASLPPSSAVIEEDASVRLTPIVVYGKEDRDTEGYNKVYDANRSSVYAGKDYVERFKGTNPADVLQGMVESIAAMLAIVAHSTQVYVVCRVLVVCL